MTDKKIDIDWDLVKKEVFDAIRIESEAKSSITIADVVDITCQVVEFKLAGKKIKTKG